MQFVAPGMIWFMNHLDLHWASLAACVCSVHHTQHWDPYPCAMRNPAYESHACSSGPYQFKSAFYLTRNALFSYFSILRAETVTPLSGELKWDCLLWYNAHISPQQRARYFPLFYPTNEPHRYHNTGPSHQPATSINLSHWSIILDIL